MSETNTERIRYTIEDGGMLIIKDVSEVDYYILYGSLPQTGNILGNQILEILGIAPLTKVYSIIFGNGLRWDWVNGYTSKNVRDIIKGEEVERRMKRVDPTYVKSEIEEKPEWDLAFVLSEIMNDNAPIGWGKYIYKARCLLAHYDIKPKASPSSPSSEKSTQ